MAASVRLEAKAFVDPRFDVLGRLLGTSRFDALGRMASVWAWCTERSRHDIPAFFLAAFFPDGAANSVVTAELAAWCECGEPESHPPGCKHLRVRGTEGRVEWLEERRSAAKAGGRARAETAQRDERGRMVGVQPNSSQVAGECPAKLQPSDQPKSSAPTPAPVLSTKDRGAAKRRLPADWTPSEQHAALAISLRVDMEREAAKFRDHFVAHGKPLADWDAAFRNWLRKSVEFAPTERRQTASGPKPPPLKLLGVD